MLIHVVCMLLMSMSMEIMYEGLNTATWLLYCLRLRSRSPHNAQNSTSYWGERERAPTLLMSMEIMYVHTSDRHTAHARTLFEFC